MLFGLALGIGELHSPGYFLRLEIADPLFPAVGNRGSPAVVPGLEAELESKSGSANCIRRFVPHLRLKITDPWIPTNEIYQGRVILKYIPLPV